MKRHTDGKHGQYRHYRVFFYFSYFKFIFSSFFPMHFSQDIQINISVRSNSGNKQNNRKSNSIAQYSSIREQK